MCGFAGFLCPDSTPGTDLLPRMGAQLAHRGPDAEGVWSDGPLGLVHRRLAIQDVSPDGAQPMVSPSGRYVIAFNGEVYNFSDLRRELEGSGIAFRGHSDTEVMLAAFEQWGVEPAIGRFHGMFSFALVDRTDRTLILARDRMGEKPLYYGVQGGALLFGSELKALKVHPAWAGRINRDALCLYLRHNYIPAPYSIYRGIGKLPPACLLRVPLDRPLDALPAPSRYWDLASVYARGTVAMPLEQRLDELDGLLRTTVRRQMISDVPLGAFLSGGIDSSTVVSLMQAQAGEPVQTFSIGFHERTFNEAEHAKAVAGHLGTNHTELYVTPDECRDVIPRLPRIYDEPFADSSQIPTFLVSEMTRRKVTVALSGDGGDELFCGYGRFMDYCALWNRIRSRPPHRELLERLLSNLPPAAVAPFVRYLVPGQRRLDLATIAEKLASRTISNRSDSLQALYRQGVSYWFAPEEVVIGAGEPASVLSNPAAADGAADEFRKLMLLDSLSYLPDDILVKVDRAAMACSLETRVPFLDHSVVEYAAAIPAEENVEGGRGKKLLRELLYRYVPPALVDRPKAGFAVPVAEWLRGPLRDWAEALLAEDRLHREGFFRPAPVRRKWIEHLDGRADNSFHLWGVLMFQAWYECESAV